MPSRSNNINNKREDDLQTERCSPPWLSSAWPTRQKPRQWPFPHLASATQLFPRQRQDGECSQRSWRSPSLSLRQQKQQRKHPQKNRLSALRPLCSSGLGSFQLHSALLGLSCVLLWAEKGWAAVGEEQRLQCWCWQLPWGRKGTKWCTCGVESWAPPAMMWMV